MNEVLITLLACKHNSRLKNPLQAKIQKLKNTRICNCIVVLVWMYMDVVLYMGGWGYVYSVPIYRLFVRKESFICGVKRRHYFVFVFRRA